MVEDSTRLCHPLHDGIPPWHAMALLGAFVATFSQQLPNRPDEVSVATFTRVLFPNLLPLSAVILMRLVFAGIIFADIFRASCTVVYLDHRTEYYPGSALRAGAPIEYRGSLTKGGTLWSGFLGVASFTMVCWLLEGITFFLAAMIPLLGDRLPPVLRQITLTLWETVAPCAFLVTLVVTYVLWPFAKAAEKQGKKGNLGLLNRLGPLLAHNLNVCAVLTELALLGGMPLQWKNYATAPLFGCLYVIFSWLMHNQWLPQLPVEQRRSWGPQYIYPFMDTSLGWKHTLSLLVLLLVLLTNYLLVFGLQYVLTWLSPHLYMQWDKPDTDYSKNDMLHFGMHCGIIVAVAWLVCRVR